MRVASPPAWCWSSRIRRKINAASTERETRLAPFQLLNERNNAHEMIKNVTGFLQKRSGCEAVGVRLKEGDDYPYFETRGFTQEFVQAESSLCGHDATASCSGTPWGIRSLSACAAMY